MTEILRVYPRVPVVVCDEDDCQFCEGGAERYEVLTDGVSDYYGKDTAVNILGCGAHTQGLCPKVGKGTCNTFSKKP